MDKKTVKDIDVSGKRVLVRVDFNVPLNENGEVVDGTRIEAALPTINYLLSKNCKVILMSHLGRPDGKVEEKLRLTPVAEFLSELLERPVKKADKTVTDEVKTAASNLKEGEILLLENLRFNPGEKKNDPEFAKNLASLADIYVNDAFGAAHRTHASTVGVANYLPAVAGLLLEKEIDNLNGLLENPKKPFIAVLGGNKVSDKVKVIDRLLDVVDGLLTGGGMCFTFLKAKGLNIGNSICQNEELEHAEEMLKKAEKNKVGFYLPKDVVVANELSESANHKVVSVENIPSDQKGLDIGPETISEYKKILATASTIFWNGPMGVFEMKPFENGTREVAQAIVDSKGTTIVGGGDSDAALKKFGLEKTISFISTGGGASLKVLEGAVLPGIEALMDKKKIRCKT
ncbi:MAG: phosphoglycerate kinase [Actinobacteria bacterium]|nr:phosphoglycerate kinase [Actinomycetota bacterium]